jgi:pheromone shutdown protein TraB
VIYVYGTSHVSEDSFSVIDEALERHDPEIVALELDYVRLNALLNNEESSGGSLFARLIRYFQESVGSKTGVMPGEEMEYAFNKAMSSGREVALVDQDIRVTLQRLKNVRRKEKVKAVFSILAGFLDFEKFDISSIPEDEVIDELVGELRDEFPGLYRVLMEERNQHIVEALRKVERESDGDIVVFLGAAHVKPVRRMLDEEVNSKGSVETAK